MARRKGSGRIRRALSALKRKVSGPGTQQTTGRAPTCTGEDKENLAQNTSSIRAHTRAGFAIEAYRAIRYVGVGISSGISNVFKNLPSPFQATGEGSIKKSERDAAAELSKAEFETKVKAAQGAAGGGGGGGGGAPEDGTPGPPEDEDRKLWHEAISKASDALDTGSVPRDLTSGQEGILFQAGMINLTVGISDTLNDLEFMSAEHNPHIEAIRDDLGSLINDVPVAAFKLYAKFGQNFADHFSGYAKEFQAQAKTVLDHLADKDRFGLGEDTPLPDHVEDAWNAMEYAEDMMVELMHAQDSAYRKYPQSLGDTSDQDPASALSGSSLVKTLIESPNLLDSAKEALATEEGYTYLANIVSDAEYQATASRVTQEAVNRLFTSDAQPSSPTADVTAINDYTLPQRQAVEREAQTIAAATKNATAEGHASELNEYIHNPFTATSSQAGTYFTQMNILPDVLLSIGQKMADDELHRVSENQTGQEFPQVDRDRMEGILNHALGLSLDMHISDALKGISEMTVLDALGSMPHHTTQDFRNDPSEAVSDGSVLNVFMKAMESSLQYNPDKSLNLSTPEGAMAKDNFDRAQMAIQSLDKFKAKRDSYLMPESDSANKALHQEAIEARQAIVALTSQRDHTQATASPEDITYGRDNQELLVNHERDLGFARKKVDEIEKDITDPDEKALTDAFEFIKNTQENVVRAEEARNAVDEDAAARLYAERNSTLTPETQQRYADNIGLIGVSPVAAKQEVLDYHQSIGDSISTLVDEFTHIDTNLLPETTKELKDVRNEIRKLEDSIEDGMSEEKIASIQRDIETKNSEYSDINNRVQALTTQKNNTRSQFSEIIQTEQRLREQHSKALFEQGYKDQTIKVTNEEMSFSDVDVSDSTDKFYGNMPELDNSKIAAKMDDGTITKLSHTQRVQADLITANQDVANKKQLFSTAVADFIGQVPKDQKDLVSTMDRIKQFSEKASVISAEGTIKGRELAALNSSIRSQERFIASAEADLAPYMSRLGAARVKNSISQGNPATYVSRNLDAMNKVLFLAPAGESWVHRMVQDEANSHLDSLKTAGDSFAEGVTQSYRDGGREGYNTRKDLRNQFNESIENNAYQMSTQSQNANSILRSSLVIPGANGKTTVMNDGDHKQFNQQMSLLMRTFRSINPSNLRAEDQSALGLVNSRVESGDRTKTDVDLSHYYGMQRSETFQQERGGQISIGGGYSVRKNEVMPQRTRDEIISLRSKLLSQVTDTPRPWADNGPKQAAWDSEGPLNRSIDSIDRVLRNQNTMAEAILTPIGDTRDSFNQLSRDLETPFNTAHNEISQVVKEIDRLKDVLPDNEAAELSRVLKRVLDKATKNPTPDDSYGAVLGNKMFRGVGELNQVIKLTDHILKNPLDDPNATEESRIQSASDRAELKKSIDTLMMSIARVGMHSDNPLVPGSLARNLSDRYTQPIVDKTLRTLSEEPVFQTILNNEVQELGTVLKSTEAVYRAYREHLPLMLADANFTPLNQVIERRLREEMGETVANDTITWLKGEHEFHQKDKPSDKSKADRLNEHMVEKNVRHSVSLEGNDTDQIMVYPPSTGLIDLSLADGTFSNGRSIDTRLLQDSVREPVTRDILKESRDTLDVLIKSLEQDPAYIGHKNTLQDPNINQETRDSVEKRVKDHEVEIKKNQDDFNTIDAIVKSGVDQLRQFRELPQGTLVSDIGTVIGKRVDSIKLRVKVSMFEENLYSLSGNVLNYAKLLHQDQGVRDAAKQVESLRSEMLTLRSEIASLKERKDTPAILAKTERTEQITRQLHDPLRKLESELNRTDITRSLLADSNLSTKDVRSLSSKVSKLDGELKELVHTLPDNFPDTIKNNINDLVKKNLTDDNIGDHLTTARNQVANEVTRTRDENAAESLFNRFKIDQNRAILKDEENGLTNFQSDMTAHVTRLLTNQGIPQDQAVARAQTITSDLITQTDRNDLSDTTRQFVDSQKRDQNLHDSVLDKIIEDQRSVLRQELSVVLRKSYNDRLKELREDPNTTNQTMADVEAAYNRERIRLQNEIKRLPTEVINSWSNVSEVDGTTLSQIKTSLRRLGHNENTVNLFDSIYKGEVASRKPVPNSDGVDRFINVQEALKKLDKELGNNPDESDTLSKILSAGTRRADDNDATKSLSDNIATLKKNNEDTDSYLKQINNLFESQTKKDDGVNAVEDNIGDVLQLIDSIRKLYQESKPDESSPDLSDPLYRSIQQIDQDGLTPALLKRFTDALSRTLNDASTNRNVHFGQTVQRQIESIQTKKERPKVILRTQKDKYITRGWLPDDQATPINRRTLGGQRGSANENQRKFQRAGAEPMKVHVDPNSVTSPYSDNKLARERKYTEDFIKRSDDLATQAQELASDDKIPRNLVKAFLDVKKDIIAQLKAREQHSKNEQHLERVYIVTDKESGVVRKLTESEYNVLIHPSERPLYDIIPHDRMPIDRQVKSEKNAQKVIGAIKTTESNLKQDLIQYQNLRAELSYQVLKEGYTDILTHIKEDIETTRKAPLSDKASTLLDAVNALAAVAQKAIGKDSERDASIRRETKKLIDEILHLTDGNSKRLALASETLVKIVDGKYVDEGYARNWKEAYGDFNKLFATRSSHNDKLKTMDGLFHENMDPIITGNLVHTLLSDPSGALSDDLRNTTHHLLDTLADSVPPAKQTTRDDGRIIKDDRDAIIQKVKDLVQEIKEGEGDISQLIKDYPDTVLSAMRKASETDDQIARLLLKAFRHDGVHQYHGHDNDTLIKAKTDPNVLKDLRLPHDVIVGILKTGDRNQPAKITKDAIRLIDGMLNAAQAHDKVVARMTDPVLSLQFADHKNNPENFGQDIVSVIRQNMDNREKDLISSDGVIVGKDQATYNKLKETVDNILRAQDSEGRIKSFDETINRLLGEVSPDKKDYPLFAAAVMDAVQARLKDIPSITQSGMDAQTVQADVTNALIDLSCATSAFSGSKATTTVSTGSSHPADTRVVAATTHKSSDGDVLAVTMHDSAGNVDHYVVSDYFMSQIESDREDGADTSFMDNGTIKGTRDLIELLDGISGETASGKALVTSSNGNLMDDMKTWASSLEFDDPGASKSILNHISEGSEFKAHESSLSLQPGKEGETTQSVDSTEHAERARELQDMILDRDTTPEEKGDLYAALFDSLNASSHTQMNINNHDDFKERVESGSFMGRNSQHPQVSGQEAANGGISAKSRTEIREMVERANTPEELSSMIRDHLLEFNKSVKFAGDTIQGVDSRSVNEKDSSTLFLNKAINDFNFQSSAYRQDKNDLAVDSLRDPLQDRSADRVYQVTGLGTQSGDSTKRWLNDVIARYFNLNGQDVPLSMKNVTSVSADFMQHMTRSLYDRTAQYDKAATGQDVRQSLNRLGKENALVVAKDIVDQNKVHLKTEWQPWMRQKMNDFFTKGDQATLDNVVLSQVMTAALREILQKVDPNHTPAKDGLLTAKALVDNRIAINRVLDQQTVPVDKDLGSLIGSTPDNTDGYNNLSYVAEHFTNAMTIAKNTPFSDNGRKVQDALDKLNEGKDPKDKFTLESTPESLVLAFNGQTPGSNHDSFNALKQVSAEAKHQRLMDDIATLTGPESRAKGTVNNDVLTKWKDEGLISADAFDYIARRNPSLDDMDFLLKNAEPGSQLQQILQQAKFLTAFKAAADDLPTAVWDRNGYNSVSYLNSSVTPEQIVNAMAYEAMLNHNTSPTKSLRIVNESARLMSVMQNITDGNLNGIHGDLKSELKKITEDVRKGTDPTKPLIEPKHMYRDVSNSEITRMGEAAKILPAPLADLINTFIADSMKITKGHASLSMSHEKNLQMAETILSPISTMASDLNNVSAKDNSDPAQTYGSNSEKVLGKELSAQNRFELGEALDAANRTALSINRETQRFASKAGESARLDSVNYNKLVKQLDNIANILPDSLATSFKKNIDTFTRGISDETTTASKLSINQARTMIALRQVYGGVSRLNGDNKTKLDNAMKEGVRSVQKVRDTIFDVFRGHTESERLAINARRKENGEPKLKVSPELNALLRKSNSADTDSYLTPQEHLLIRALISKNSDVIAAVESAKTALKNLGADSTNLFRKLRVSKGFDDNTDVIANVADPYTQLSQSLGTTLEALTRNFDVGYLVHQVNEEIANLPQTLKVNEAVVKFGETTQRYKLNPGSPYLQPARDLDNQKVDPEQQAYELDQLAKSLRDMVNIDFGGNGTKTRHDYMDFLTTVDGINSIVTLASNVPALLEGIADPTSTVAGVEPHMELENHMYNINSTLAAIGPTPATNTKVGNQFNEPIERVDIEGQQYTDSGDLVDPDNVLAYYQNNDTNEPSAQDGISNPRNIEQEVDFFRTVASGTRSGMERLTQIGREASGLKGRYDEVAKKIALPFMQGSGPVTSTVSLIKAWNTVSKRDPNYKATADSALANHIIQTFEVNNSKPVLEAIRTGNMDRLLLALDDNGFSGVLKGLVDVETANAENQDPDGGAPLYSNYIKKGGDVSMDQHVTDLAAQAVIRKALMDALPKDQIVSLHGEFNDYSQRIMNIVGRNTADSEATIPLVSDRDVEFAALRDIIDSGQIHEGDIHADSRRHAQDVAFAKTRIDAIGKQEGFVEPNVKAIQGAADDSSGFTQEANDRAQELLARTAASKGATSVPELNHAYAYDRLSSSDPMSRAIMQIANETLGPNAKPEDTIVAFRSIAAVMDLHDIAFPSNNKYAQNQFVQAIKDSKGAFSSRELQDFMASDEKQQEAFTRIHAAVEKARLEETDLSAARKGLTQKQLEAFETSNPDYEIVKNKRGELKVRLSLDHADGSTTRFTAKEGHLMSSLGATLGLDVSQVTQVNHLYSMEGEVAAAKAISEANPNLSRDEVVESVKSLHAHVTNTKEKGKPDPFLIPVEHLAVKDVGGSTMEAYRKAISGKTETVARDLIDSVVKRSGGANITQVQFSSSDRTPTVVDHPIKPGESILNVPYTMIGRPATLSEPTRAFGRANVLGPQPVTPETRDPAAGGYSDQSEKAILSAQAEGYINAFAKYHIDKGSPVITQNTDSVLRKSRNQHKAYGTDKLQSLETTPETVSQGTVADEGALNLAQGATIDAIQNAVERNQLTLTRTDANVAAERAEALTTVADVDLYGRDQTPDEFAQDAIDYALAAQEAPTTNALNEFAAATPSRAEADAAGPNLGALNPELNQATSLGSRKPEEFLEGEALADYQRLATGLKFNTKALSKVQNEISKLVSARTKLDGNAQSDVIKTLQDEMKQAELDLQGTVTDLTYAQNQADAWSEAFRAAADTGLLDNVKDSEVAKRIASDNYNNLAETLGTKPDKILKLDFDTEKIASEVARLSKEADAYQSTVRLKQKQLNKIKADLGVDVALADDNVYVKSINERLATAMNLAKNTSSLVQGISSVVTTNMAENQPQVKGLFDSLESGIVDSFFDQDIVADFKNLGFTTEFREGQPIRFVQRDKIAGMDSIFEAARIKVDEFRESMDTESILDRETLIDLEYRMEKIREAADWLYSVETAIKSGIISTEDKVRINEITREYMEYVTA